MAATLMIVITTAHGEDLEVTVNHMRFESRAACEAAAERFHLPSKWFPMGEDGRIRRLWEAYCIPDGDD